MTTERGLQLSHVGVRIVAVITLSIQLAMVICQKFYFTYAHALANSPIGTLLTLWLIAAPLILLLYVGLEGWWMHKCNVASRALWVDVGLAIACFLMLAVMVLYAFGHYAMI